AFLLRQPDVTHVAIAFDHVIESFRNRMFDGYKTGLGIEPALRSQFELVEDATRAMGIVTWPLIEFEADDGMAAGAARFADHPDVTQVVLCSPDKDLTQCVRGDQVICLDRMRKKTLNEAGVIEKFGVPPLAIPDYLALVGDAADGIPGLARWGAKSTAQVLARYGSLAAIPDDAADWDIKVRGGAGLAKTLASQRQDAELYRTLATLRTDVPMVEAVSLDDLRWERPSGDGFERFVTDTLGASKLVGLLPAS
ncbi:MAG: 5'-3' exonuclease, partial [Myxococcota bacterium]